MKKRKVSIVDVAQAAGVSTTAVSFAFNNPNRLNSETVAHILKMAHRLGYAANPHARALIANSIGVIGVLVPQSLPTIYANPFYMAFFEGVGHVCEENGLSMLILSPVAGSISEAIAKAPVDGFIVVGFNEDHSEIEMLYRRGSRFVIVDGDAENVPSVNVDDTAGARLAAEHLLALGHRDVAYMTFETDFNVTRRDMEKVYGVGNRRLNGYRSAFEEHGLGWDIADHIPTPMTIDGAAEVFRNLWQKRQPTAVIAIADIIAIGVLEAAAQLGISVPEQLSVIGFDDIPITAWTYPPLTTIRQPVTDKGEQAAQLLLHTIEDKPLDGGRRVVLPCELIVRQSTAKPGR